MKNNLSAYLRKVRAGQPLVIYDRDLPIARIERIEVSGRTADRLALLQSQGVIKSPARVSAAKQLRARLRPAPLAGLAKTLRDLRDADR